jgi:hypothetical protein
LPFEGENSFSALVARYAGDIPAGAMRAAFRQANVVQDDSDGCLLPRRRFFVPIQLNEHLIKGIFFSLSNLGRTVAHNADLRRSPDSRGNVNLEHAHLERIAWTDHISLEGKLAFRKWVRDEGARFAETADRRLGEHELPRDAWTVESRGIVGVGVYYFEEDKPSADR